MAYLDNNATTFMSGPTIKTINKWFNRGNPSASYPAALQGQRIMTAFRDYIASVSGMAEPSDWDILITSGASESNTQAIVSTVRAAGRSTSERPHVVTTAIEHKSITLCIEGLVADSMCDATAVDADLDGIVDPKKIAAAIIPGRTCMVVCMSANNETGAINDIASMSRLAHAAGVPLFTDAVQIFGKYPEFPIMSGADAFSASAHKFGGPVGCGILVISKQWVAGYGLCAHVCGTQNFGLRGGTENVPLIAGTYSAIKESMYARAAKNDKLARLRDAIKAGISMSVPTLSLTDYARRWKSPRDIGPDELMVVWLAPDDDRKVLPNTLLLSVVKQHICNSSMKTQLAYRNVIVSIGSACNTSDHRASHVLYSAGVPRELFAGTLRITVGDKSTDRDVDLFLDTFVPMILSDCCQTKK